MEREPPPSPENLIPLQEYQSLTGLFQFYLDLVFKAFTFTLAAGGAVAAFVIEKGGSAGPNARFVLMIPALLAATIAASFFRGLKPARELDHTLRKHARDLKMALPPHATNLVGALWLFGLVLAAVAISLFAVCFAWSKLGFGQAHPSG